MSWQPIEAIWSDPQVLAYLDGPAPTHAPDSIKPELAQALEDTCKVLMPFWHELVNADMDSLKTGVAALVQSKALLLLVRIIHWLQKRPSASLLLPSATGMMAGPALWESCTLMLWRLMDFICKTGPAHCPTASQKSACAQLLASGESQVTRACFFVYN